MKSRAKRTISKKTEPVPAAQTFSPEEWKKLNEGIAEYFEMAWTPENDAVLKRELGDRLFGFAKELSSLASSGDEWLQGSLSSAGDSAAARVRQKYPLIHDVALERLILRAQYGWR